MNIKAETEAERQALAVAKDRFAASAVMGHLSAGQSSQAWSMRLALGARVLTQRILSLWKRPERILKRGRATQLK